MLYGGSHSSCAMVPAAQKMRPIAAMEYLMVIVEWMVLAARENGRCCKNMEGKEKLRVCRQPRVLMRSHTDLRSRIVNLLATLAIVSALLHTDRRTRDLAKQGCKWSASMRSQDNASTVAEFGQ